MVSSLSSFWVTATSYKWPSSTPMSLCLDLITSDKLFLFPFSASCPHNNTVVLVSTWKYSSSFLLYTGMSLTTSSYPLRLLKYIIHKCYFTMAFSDPSTFSLSITIPLASLISLRGFHSMVHHYRPCLKNVSSVLAPTEQSSPSFNTIFCHYLHLCLSI